MAGEIARAFVRIVPNSSGFQSNLERQTSGIGKSVGGKIGKAMAVGIGGGLAVVVGGLASATKLAIDFDKSMRNVNSIAKLNSSDFADLNKKVLALGKTAGVAPKQLADGLYDVVSSGFKANDALKILTAGAKAGKAGLTDTATATGAVVSVLNAYHLSAKDAVDVSDTLFQTVNVGVVNFEQLASSIGDVLPFASSLGVSINDVGASIATMTKEGINAAESTTRIKAVMTQFLSPSKDLAARFKDLGFSSGEAMIKSLGFQGALDKLAKSTHGSKAEMAKLFPDVRALGGALALTGENSKTANADLIALRESQGATAAAAKEQAKSISAQWDKAIGKLQASAIQLGTQILPVVSDGIGIFSELTDKVAELAAKPTLKLKAEFVLDQITSAAGSIKDAISGAIDEALNGTTSVGGGKFNNAIGMVDSASLTDQLTAAFQGVDWGAVGSQVIAGLKSALSTGEDIMGDVIAQMNASVGAHAGDIANTGALILANLVTTLSDPGFWLAHWQLAIGVAIAVFPVGKFARIGELILVPFAKLGARLAPILSDLGAKALVAILGPLERFGGRAGRILVSGLLKLGGAIVAAAKFLGGGIIEGIVGLLSTGGGKIKSILQFAMKTGIVGAIVAAVGAAKNLGAKVISGVTSGLATLFSAVTSAFGQVKDAVSNAASSALSWAESVGSALIDGIVSGIQSSPGRVLNALGGVVSSAISHARSLLHIGSPSRVFAEQVGEPISAGIAVGITNKTPLVHKALKATLTSAAKSALVDAKANMQSLAGGLGDMIGQIIDEQTRRAIAPLQAQLDASQKSSAAADLERQRADLQAQLGAGKTEGESDADFIARMKDVRQQIADMDKAAQQQALQDQIDGINTAAEKRKDATSKSIADLSAEFTAGKITGKQFTDGLTAILKANGASVASAGDLLGFAFAQAFSAQLQGVTKQIGAIAAVIGATGGGAGGSGFDVSITDPVAVIRQQLKDAKSSLKQDQKDLKAAHKTKSKSDDAAAKRAIQRDEKMIRALNAILRFVAAQGSSGTINVAMTAGVPSIDELLAAVVGDAAR